MLERLLTARRLTVAAFAVLIVSAFSLKFAPAKLISLPFGVSPIGGKPKWVVLNPLRERSPERTAHAFLMAMRDGDCERVRGLSKSLKLPNGSTCEEFPSQTFAKGDEYRRVLNQRLRDRTDSGDRCSLWYSDDGCGGNWLVLRRDGNTWKVTAFQKMW